MRQRIIFVLIMFCTAAFPQKKELNIVVDERVELMTMVQLICESGVMTLTNADINYTKEVEQRFGKFKHHPAVATFDSIYYRYFNFEMPFQYILHYSLPEFTVSAPLTAGEFSSTRFYVEHADTLSIFMRQLKDLYIQSQFHEFFLSHRSFYDSLCGDVASTLGNIPVVPALERYYGASFTKYQLVLSPLSLDGGFGITVKNKTEAYVYAVIGPAYTSKQYPQFKKNKTIILHEMSHPFSNPVIDSCWSILKYDTCLYRPVKREMQKEGYWNWMSVAYETLNRANEVMLTYQLLGRTEGDELLANYIGKRYDYLPLCLDVVRTYDAQREKYHSIGDIRAMLLQAFERKMNEQCP